ncbi:MAG: hypothetical protein ABI411_12260 [Tahibacter sp.]
MPSTRSLHREAGASIVRILGAVLLIVALFAWTMYHANFVLGRSMLLAFPGDDTTYRGGWPSVTGTVSATDIVFPEAEGSNLKPFHFDKLRVEVPFWQYVSSGFSSKRGALLNAIREVRIELSGGSGQYGLPFTNELSVFGAASAAPFETAGCAHDDFWGSDAFAAMGLSPGPTQLVVSYQRERGELKLEQSLETPGLAKVSYSGNHQMNDNFSLFSLLDGGNNGIVSDEWHLQDLGFNAARNRYCAKKDKITEVQFVDRHVAVVKRGLAALGLAVNPATEAAYRDYALHGGALDVSVKYEPALAAEMLDNENLGSWVPSMHGQLSINGKPLALGLESTPVRALPDAGDDGQPMNVLAVLQREGADPLTAPLAAEVPAAMPDPFGAAMPVGSTPASAGVAATPPVVASAVSATAPAMSTAAPVTATPRTAAGAAPKAPPSGADLAFERMSAAAPVTPRSAAATPAGSAVASSLAAPVSATRAAVNPAASPSPAAEQTQLVYSRASHADDGHLPYTELGNNIGRRFRVYLRERAPVVVEVSRVEKGIVYVSRRVAGGSASYPLDKASFDYAELID